MSNVDDTSNVGNHLYITVIKTGTCNDWLRVTHPKPESDCSKAIGETHSQLYLDYHLYE